METAQKNLSINDMRNKSIVIKTLNDNIFSTQQREVLNKYYLAFLSGEFNRTKSYNTIRLTFDILKQHTYWLNNVVKVNNYNNVTEQHLKEYFASQVERGMSNSTIITNKAYIRPFYKWLDKEDIVKWIKTNREKRFIDENQLVTYDDIKKIVSKADNPRDKAIVKTMYEGALRNSELADIKLSDVKIETIDVFENNKKKQQEIAKITVKGKTGKRTVLVVDCVGELKDLINNHPFKSDSNHILFISYHHKTYGRKLFPNNVGGIITRLATKAGIQKKIYPHLFRHSKLNDLAKKAFNERDLRIFAGWSSTSNMPDIYLHYGETQVEQKILKQRGLYKDDSDNSERKKIERKICPVCNKINSSDSVYCSCGAILDYTNATKDMEQKEEATNLMNNFSKTKYFQEAFERFYKEYNKK